MTLPVLHSAFPLQPTVLLCFPAGVMEEAKGYRLQGPQEVQGLWHHHAQHWVWQQQEDQALDAHRCARRQLGWLCRLGWGPASQEACVYGRPVAMLLRQMHLPAAYGVALTRQAGFHLRTARCVSPSGDSKHALWTACCNGPLGKLGQPLSCHVG